MAQTIRPNVFKFARPHHRLNLQFGERLQRRREVVLIVERTVVATVIEIHSHAQALRGTIERESDNSSEIKAFASFSSRIAKFAVMLDVATFLPRFLFQGTVSLIREHRKSIIIRGESQRSGGGLERDIRAKHTETRMFCAHHDANERRARTRMDSSAASSV